MLKHTTDYRPLKAAAVALFVALVFGACSGGERPTVTTDRLPEEAIATPTELPFLQTPDPEIAADEPSAAPDGATADGADPDGATADGATTDGASPDGTVDPSTEPVEQLTVEILETLPHDSNAFTQGLELYNGDFIESTGLFGESDLRRVVPTTGEVLQITPVPDEFFAEGVTRVDNQLIQLTWRAGTAFFYDLDTFAVTKEVSYQGEGWGLCYDGTRLVMTDGTPVLIFRDPVTFDETGRLPVSLNGEDVFNLNEVECVNGEVWANIWQTDLIVRIDPTTGVVTGVVDAVLLPGRDDDVNAVLNGIAWDETTQSFYVTGKLWPNMFRVNFVPSAG